jgi:tetratricopeptide (TPR) repeat protein
MGRWLVVSMVAIALAWAPALDAPYQYDDYVTPLKDPASQSLGSWAAALPGTLRPLTKLTYALESSIGVRSAPARRVLELLMFAGCTATLAALIGGWLGIGLATLWAVHPVHAETVIALAGRSVLLSLLLILGSALCLQRQRAGWAIALALLAVLARETALAWCVACILLTARWRTSLGAAAVASLVVLASDRMRALLVFSFTDPSALNRLGLQWAALPRGTSMLVTDPGGFSVDIEFNPLGLPRTLWVLAALALYAGASWLALRGDERVRHAALLWLALVVPLHSVVPKLDALTARSFSASSAALAMLLACGWKRVLPQSYVRGAVACVALAVCTLIPRARQRAELYGDPVALWRDAAERSQQTTRPWVNLGTLLAQRGQLEPARAALEEALRRNPNGTDVRERLSAVDVLIQTRRLLTEPPLEEIPLR